MVTGDEATARAGEHLRAEGSPWVAGAATRSLRFGVWLVGYRDPAAPDLPLDGGGLVVTDDGDVHEVGSAPGSLDDLMNALGRWPGAEPADVFEREGEGLALLADVDPDEAAGLAAWAEERRRLGDDA